MQNSTKSLPKNSAAQIDFQSSASSPAASEDEQDYRNLGEAIMHQVWTATPDGRIDYVNCRVLEYFGRSNEQMLGEGWQDFIHPDDLPACIKRWQHSLATGDFYEVEFRLRRADGEYRWHLARATARRDGRGKIAKWFGTGTDIQEQKSAESALRESEEQFRSIVETTSEWIWAINARGNLTYSNPAIEAILGFTVKELLGKSFLSLLDKSERVKFKRLLSDAVEKGRGWTNMVCCWRHKNGTLRYLESDCVPVFDGDGKVVGFRGADRDITERKRAEDALRANLSLLTSTFEATADGILVIDLNDCVVTFNKQFVEMWQIPERVIKTRNCSQIVKFIVPQLKNGAEFADAVQKLNARPETKSFYLLEFNDGKIFERYSQPQMLDGQVVGRVISVRDITERRQAECSLRESQERYLQLFDSTPHPMWVYDLETLRFLAVNREAVKQYGYTREEFLRMSLADIRPPEDAALLRDYVEEVAAEKVEKTRLVRHRKKDGTIIDVEISTQPIEFGSRAARLALAADITERKRTDAALRESEGKFRMLVEGTSEGLLQVDQSDRVEFVNRRLCEMVGYSQDELIGADWTRLLLDDEGREFIEQVNERRRRGISDRYEIKLKKKSGETLWVIIGGAPVINHEGKVVGSMGIYTDINERKLAEEQLLHDAFHDGLTGLANRSLFMDHLRLIIERGKSRHSNMYAVLFLDFDRFKLINDSLGHADGDKLLKLVARRLETCTRTGDLVARLGGDEFVILLSELVDEADALRVAERIQESLKTPFDLSGHEVFISVSIGITLSTARHECAEEMLRNADIAMYRAKAKGKAQHQVFDIEMHKNAMAQLQFETEMRYALERGEFRIHYQPIYSLATKNPVGFEALLRWQHPTRGLISPAEFIPLAEENGMIIRLGRWTVYESCRQMREWQKTNPAAESLTVAVNLSCKEFLQIDLAEQITATLASTGLEPHCLKLEITESHIMENSKMAITIMERLRARGIELSLDDFGTGYSSLSYLHRLPVSYLKVDRSFINGLTDSRENAEIVFTIVKLAQNLKMKVIAEGIETADQLRYLEQINCEYGQGYYFSKPLDAENARNLIEGMQKTVGIDRRNPHDLSDQPIINLDLNA